MLQAARGQSCHPVEAQTVGREQDSESMRQSAKVLDGLIGLGGFGAPTVGLA
jgi:hypothetical protein